MKKCIIGIACALVLFSCKNPYEEFQKAVEQQAQDQVANTTQEDIDNNVAKIFGSIDPNHTWNSITQGSVSITADADLDDIVKVQVLTESPFFNEDAKVLNETNASKGQTVTLSYEAPSYYDHLVAACVNSRGMYYIQVFDINDSHVNFAEAQKTRSMTRGEGSFPELSSLKLGSPKQSFNAMRAEKKYGVWAEESGQDWINDRLWEVTGSGDIGSGWNIELGSIYREIDSFGEKEEANLREICNRFLVKLQGNTKKNNLKLIEASSIFSFSNNQLSTDGSAITLIPIQAYTTEFKLNTIYYYYYRPEQLNGMSSEQQMKFFKSLPKFKAVKVEKVQTSAEMNAGAMYRRREYLLPFYGDSPQAGQAAVSATFPKGYKIGFLNQKRENDKYDGAKNGCSYGDGRLNYELNHVAGHYKSAMDKSLGGNIEGGMSWTSPRIAFFGANKKTYMCFEDGSDCNFCDMIFEVSNGTEVIDEPQTVEENVYTLMFEDRPIADYDLNDVVLQFRRVGDSQVKVSLVACGANDKLFLNGLNGQTLNGNREIHEILGFGNDILINTGSDNGTSSRVCAPVEEIFNLGGADIATFAKRISISDKTTNATISFSEKGQDPHAILVPCGFPYPMEKVCITSSYPKFKEWAQNQNNNIDWYLYPSDGKTFYYKNK